MKTLLMSALSNAARWRRFSLVIRLCILGAMLLLQAAPARAAFDAVPASNQEAPIAVSDQPDFGPNVYIFDPSMSTSQIQATVDAIAAQQVDNEMGSQRYSLLFKPGTYGTPANPLILQVGYYTEVAGLGLSPTDVTINGHVDVYNRCLTPNNCIALVNFWRSLSNLTINVIGLSGCRSSGDFWAVSQAAPMRRVNITGGNLTLMDYCTAGPQYASGGFMADTQTGFIINGSQQQFLVRDSTIGGWSNAVWNQVFSGVQGAPAQSFPNPPYTTLPASPVTEEKPYLYVDPSGNYSMFKPALRTNSAGTTWADGPTPGDSTQLGRFYVATPADSAETINEALQRVGNLIFTPGVYHVNQTINVKRPNTIVYGMGFATIIPDNGVIAMKVADVEGVKISGLLFDAGPVNSPVLLQVGSGMPAARPIPNPTVLHDVFFRIGGTSAGKVTTSLVVNNNDTILDDIWAWRADHGTGVGWTVNTADTGLIVNGARVTAYGLFVEHYQKYEVIWNGNDGTDIFFQNEMPYDPPNQAAWMNGSMNGYAAFKVGDDVTRFQGYGLGSYCYFNVNPTVNAYHAFEAPNRPQVQFHDLLTISLAAGTITHVINDTGDTTPLNVVPVNIVSYP
ncbi:MAG: adenylyl cyclase [Chloroflexia bacterium]